MTIYVFVGTPASGKTTLAQTMVRYMNAVIISRDSLREMLHGYKPENMRAYWDREDLGALEKQINEYQDVLIKEAIRKDKDVLLDNTNLRMKYINDLKKYNVPLKFILQEVDFETALERDSLRARSVGEDVLMKMFGDLENLKKNFDFEDWYPAEVPFLGSTNIELGGAFIFDIDGTLALNTSGRSPYDYHRVDEDQSNMPVVEALDGLRELGWPIILCSGRPERSRKDTEQWLEDHGIRYDKLYMRKDGDNRPDFTVKEELWREILKHNNILCMFDDRQQVVDHARKLGFTVFQVAPGNF